MRMLIRGAARPVAVVVFGVFAASLPASPVRAGLPGADQPRGREPAETRPGNRLGGPAPETAHSGSLKAMGLSLLLPGLAQLEMGETTRGVAFLVAEAGFWTAFTVYRVQGHLRQDSYVEMLNLYAGVERPEGRGDEYYRRLGLWPSADSYNRVIRTEARALYPEDLAARERYFEENRVPADESWAWQTQVEWDRYREKRNDSRSAFRRSRNMLGLAAANRVVAMIDAALLARRGNERALHLDMTPGREPASAELRLSWSLP